MEITRLLLLPALASVVTLVVVAINRVHAPTKRPHSILIAYLFATGFTWATFYQCYYHPAGFIYTHHLAMLSFLIMPVFLYQLIFEATKIDASESFSRIHYFVPVFITLVLLVASLLTPKKVQIDCFATLGQQMDASYDYFLWLAGNRMRMRLVLSLLYTIMGFQRLSSYRRAVINYSANDATNRLSWVFWLLFASASLVVVPFLGAILSRKDIFLSVWLYIQGGLIIALNIYLSVYVIQWRRFVYRPEGLDSVCQSGVNAVSDDRHQPDDRQLSDDATVKGFNKLHFEQFMSENKPYLNPDLRIADLAAELNVNRTTLSVFINETYQMNYSCFINGYRYETFKQLVKQPENAILTKSALAERAGFHSYRSLLRYQNKGTTHENKGSLKQKMQPWRGCIPCH